MIAPLLVSLSVALAAQSKPDAGMTSLDVAPVTGHPNLLASQVPAIPAELNARVAQYLNARSAALFDVTQDGHEVLIGTRFANSVQLHLVTAPLGYRQQLTFFDEPVSDARLVPGDPQTVIYRQDNGGGEFFQLYRLDRRTGQSQLLTDGKSRHEAMALSFDGKQLAYGGTDRNGKDTDVYLADLSAPQNARRVVEVGGAWQPLEFSRDGKRLLIRLERAIDDADLFVVDLATLARTRLTPDASQSGKAGIRKATFAPDGNGVYLVTERYSDFAELYRIDLRALDAKPKPLSHSIPWNVEHLAIASDGNIAFSTNEDGLSRLYLLPHSGKPSAVPLPNGVIGGLSFPRKSSDVLTFGMITARSPSDIWQLDLRKRRLTRWTQSELGGIDPSSLVEPKLIRYPSSDDVHVPAFVYQPAAPGKEKLPVVVIWHGGPEAQIRPTFSPLIALLNEVGIVVVAPNVRGSDGYGKSYLAMDDGVKREQSLQDIRATFDWIAQQPELDASRVGVYGGSYGGYMTLASATFFPDRVRAAVDVVGISNIGSFLNNTQAYRRDLRRVEYGDERVPEVRKVQERISPLNSADKIQAALFVQQGKNDPRVPQSEAEQIVRAVRAGRHEAWYLLALDEGHGFQKKENRDFATLATLYFLEQKLLAAASPASGAHP